MSKKRKVLITITYNEMGIIVDTKAEEVAQPSAKDINVSVKDCISRQAAIDAIGKTADELYENIKKGATFPQRQWFDGMAQAQSILEDLPSAQPDIILCPNCRYNDGTAYCELHYRDVKAKDFCSWAERRE